MVIAILLCCQLKMCIVINIMVFNIKIFFAFRIVPRERKHDRED